MFIVKKIIFKMLNLNVNRWRFIYKPELVKRCKLKMIIINVSR